VARKIASSHLTKNTAALPEGEGRNGEMIHPSPSYAKATEGKPLPLYVVRESDFPVLQ
jgi:hypothetical protein